MSCQEHQWTETTSDLVQRCSACGTARYVPSAASTRAVADVMEMPLRFTRMMLEEHHPDAVWNRDWGIWQESDEAFRKRILEILHGVGKSGERIS